MKCPFDHRFSLATFCRYDDIPRLLSIPLPCTAPSLEATAAARKTSLPYPGLCSCIYGPYVMLPLDRFWLQPSSRDSVWHLANMQLHATLTRHVIALGVDANWRTNVSLISELPVCMHCTVTRGAVVILGFQCTLTRTCWYIRIHFLQWMYVSETRCKPFDSCTSTHNWSDFHRSICLCKCFGGFSVFYELKVVTYS